MRTRPLAAGAVAFAAAGLLAAMAAQADQPSTAPAAGLDPTFVVGVVRGESVNLRVGPRQDDAPVMTLDEGTVVVIVERAGDWVGVRLPSGFVGAVSAGFTEVVDSEHVRVTGSGVNLRRGPGLDQPAFRDRLEKGAVLPVMEREGDWILVEAPEEVRAYIHRQFVDEKGPVAEQAARVEEARRRRAAREAVRKEAVARGASAGDDEALREALLAAGKALAALRGDGGYDVGPVAVLEDALDAAVEARKHASARTKALAAVVLEDLRREQAIRVAFADEILAKKRLGQAPPAKAKPPAEAIDVDATGLLRWEPAPGWDGGGAFVLWSSDKPTHALKWGRGDLKAFDGKRVRVRGKQTGGRLLGLPAVEVASVE